MTRKIITLFLIGMILMFFWFVPILPILSGKTLIFIFIVSLNLVLKPKAKYTIMIGLLLLLLTALTLSLNHPGSASRVSIYAYGFLLIGAIFQFFE